MPRESAPIRLCVCHPDTPGAREALMYRLGEIHAACIERTAAAWDLGDAEKGGIIREVVKRLSGAGGEGERQL